MQKHNEHVFIDTLGSTFIFKAMDINHQPCPPFHKLLNHAIKIISLHSTIQIFKKMLVELYASNYATYDGLVNGLMTFLKHQRNIVTKPS